MADDPIMLFNHVDFESTIVGSADAIWIGHNRAATIGDKSRINAHPFKCGSITGVHNGTLDKESFFELAARLDQTYGTDSETIFQHIETYGIEDTVPRLQGAYALVWYNSKAQSLNMIKNYKRPLFTCKVERKEGAVLTWASEYEMIIAARAMANSDDGELYVDKDNYGYFPLPNDMLHTWTRQQLIEGDLEPKIKFLEGKPDPIVEKTPAFTPTFINNTVSNSSNNNHNVDLNPTKASLIADVFEVTNMTGVEASELILGCMEQDEWDEISRFGCTCCSADVNHDEEGIVVYVNEGIVICPNCSGEAKTVVSNGYGINMTERMTQ